MEGLKEFVEYGVIGLLLGLSFWAIGVVVERGLLVAIPLTRRCGKI